MAVTYTYSGSLNYNFNATVTFGGDQGGNQQGTFSPTIISFGTSGGSAPTLSGFVKGSVNATTGTANLRLAHATNVFVSCGGTATYSDGFTVAGSKVKLLAFQNNDTTASITIVSATANGFTLMSTTASSLAPLLPGGIHTFYFPSGWPSGGLTAGTNDQLGILADVGSPSLTVLVCYGP